MSAGDRRGAGHPAVPAAVRRPAGMEGDLHGEGHAVLRAAGRRHADLRAGRPAGVQLSSLPLAQRAAGRCSGRWCSRSAPPPPTTGSSSWRSASIRSIPRIDAPLLLQTQALRADGGVSRPDRAGGRADDAADGGVSGEPRPRRRAVASLVGAERRGAVRDGDLRQLPAVRRLGDRLPEHPGAGVARARSRANRAARGTTGRR